METIPSAAGTGSQLTIGTDDFGRLNFRTDGSGYKGYAVAVDPADLLATLARVADVTIIDNRDLPEVDERGLTVPEGVGWLTGDHEGIAERARRQIRQYVAVLRFHEAKMAEERKAAERKELEAIED